MWEERECWGGDKFVLDVCVLFVWVCFGLFLIIYMCVVRVLVEGGGRVLRVERELVVIKSRSGEIFWECWGELVCVKYDGYRWD